ncbi:hypothetical protein A45J_2620 [hot springs metagenome]|uniref:Uncharacterized protein n=1 Tax=hot springs metagenome TaxID=433727 RepID=A0A5J4L002_9ZZZZ
MKDFIAEGIRDLSVGLILAAVIAALIEQKAFTGATISFASGIVAWFISIKIKSQGVS